MAFGTQISLWKSANQNELILILNELILILINALIR
jgi:hypothetical protein